MFQLLYEPLEMWVQAKKLPRHHVLLIDRLIMGLAMVRDAEVDACGFPAGGIYDIGYH